MIKKSVFRKSMVIGIIIFFVGVSMILNFNSSVSASGGNIIYVDDDADPSWYDATHVKTIQEGIDNASISQSIYIHNGTYNETITVDKSLNIFGENRDTVVIDGGNDETSAVNITSENVTISNLTVTGVKVLPITEGFESGMPAGWTQTQYSGDGFWDVTTYGSHNYEAGGNGLYFADAWDNDNPSTNFDVGLFSPSLDYSGRTSVNLSFWRNFQDYSGSGEASIKTYSGGKNPGNLEETLWSQSTDDFPGNGIFTELNFNPSNYSDPSDVYIEFWYTDDSYYGAWGFCIDDVDFDMSPVVKVGIETHSNGTSVNRCNITGNGIGMLVNSNVNASYNNFWDNSENVNDSSSSSSYSFNYWDTYDESGEGAYDNNVPFGIADDPYQIPGGSNFDNYPLMYPLNWQIVANFIFSIDKFNITFNSTSFSYAGDIVNYTWNLDDGNYSYESDFIYEYASVGTYHVTLTVEDSDGNIDDITYEIFIQMVENLNTGEKFETIQETIDDADTLNGHTIFISGVYNESIRVNKSLNLVSEDKNTTIIDGGGSGTIVNVSADWVNISGFTIQNSGSNWNDAGIEIHSNHTTISDNIILNNYQGIYLYNSMSNTITGNNISSNNGYGVFLKWYSNSNTITGNLISDNGGGIVLNNFNSYNVIVNNTINSNHGGIALGYSDNNNNIITYNTVSNSQYGYGISLDRSMSNTIANNTVSNIRENGIYLYYSHGCNIENNTVSNSTENHGIYLARSHTTTIMDNIVSNNNQCGILLDVFGHNNDIINNTVYSNQYGISIKNSDYNTLINNNASYNTYGIQLSSSRNDILSGNIMLGNTYNFGVSGGSEDYIHNIDKSNTVNNNPIYYLVGVSDLVINSSTNVGYLAVVNGINVTVRDLTLTNNQQGILFVNTLYSSIENVITNNMRFEGISLILLCNNNIIRNSTANSNYYGIRLGGSNNIVTNNNVSNNINGIYVTGDYNNIMNNTANSCDYGVYVDGSGDYNNVTSNNVNSNDYGIYLSGADYNNIMNNTINSRYAIYLRYSSYNNIINNTINPWYYIGIYLYHSSNNNIMNNTANPYGYSTCYKGIELLDSCSNNIISNNTISYNRWGIDLNYRGSCNNNIISYNNISNNVYGGVSISSSNSNTITDNIISNSNVGIRLTDSSSSNTISNNSFFNSGLRIYDSYQNTVSNNTVNVKPLVYLESESDKVIDVDAGQVILINCDNITVQNQVISNTSVAIELWATTNSLIAGNIIGPNNYYSICLYEYSNGNIITGNNISNNNFLGGIYILDSSDNNISSNNISKNDYGIYMYYSNGNAVYKNYFFNNTDYGVYLYGSCSENWILLNDFVNNNDENVQAFDAYTTNHWNNNALGNYWSDYIVRYPSAINISGVWDTPYNIDGGTGAADYYPSVLPILSVTEPLYYYQISPDHGPNSITISTVIVGEGFTDGASAKLVRDGEDDIIGEGIEVLNEYKIIVKFNLSWKTVGLWDVVILLPSGEEYRITNGFEIVNFSFNIIYPDYGYNVTSRCLVNLYGLGFTDGVIVKLTRDGEDDIVGEDTILLSVKQVITRFNLTNRTIGLWNVTVTLPSGHQGYLLEAFEIREVTGYFPDIFVPAGDSLSYSIMVSETDDLFITLQKTNLISYGNSWNGKLSIRHNGVEIKSDSGSHDLILHLKDPTPGLYIIEVTAYQSGNGILSVQTSLPELPLGEWIVDTIYCSYGSTWFQVEVPPNQDTLYLEAEGMGYWSIIDIYYDRYGGSNHWKSPMAYADLQTSIEIPNPPSGTYIVEFMDSAMIFNGNIWSEDQSREILIKADTTFTIELPPDYLPIITSISPNKGGNTGEVTIEINGAWLDQNATVKLIRSGYNDILAKYVEKELDSLTLKATFDLVDKDPGEWILIVINPNNRNATAPSNFIIEEGGEPNLWAEIVGRDKTRVGREQTYVIRYGNQGLTDAQDVILAMKMPVELNYTLNIPLAREDLFPIERPLIFISLIKVPAGSKEEFTINLLSSDVSENSMSTGLITSLSETGLFQPGETMEVNLFQSEEIGDESDKPKPGEIVFRYFGSPPGLDPSHDGVYYEDIFGNQWVIDFRKDGNVYKVPFDIWKTENGLDTYIGHTHPPGWTEEIGRQIAYDANEKFLNGETGTYWGLPVLPNLDNCNTWIGKLYKKNGRPYLHDPFTAPITLYQRWAEDSGNLKNYIYWLAPDQINYLLLEQLEDFLLNYFYELFYLYFQSVVSLTPEDKYGPTGFDISNTSFEDKMRYVQADKNFYYKIDFWNKENATAPACDVYVNDQLDANLNWSTFRFEEIGFLNWTVKLEQPCQYFNIYVDTRPEMDLIVNIEGIFNPQTGVINWTFKSLDPATLETPDDPLAGFLPPINESGYEIGWVCFSVDTESGLQTGTQIENQAFVNFDGVGPFNPAPKEGPFINTIDAAPPTSNMTAVLLENYTIQLNWSGTDDLNGSGIRDYTIYVSIDNLTYIPLIHRTTNLSSKYVGEEGHIYSFYCTARDNVGNEEDIPSISDMVISTFHPVADADGPYNGTEGQPVIFYGNASYDPFEDSLLFRWDFNNDSQWDTDYLTDSIANFTWYDDYTGTVTLEVYDGVFTDINTTTVIINNVAPNITSLTLPADPIAVNTTIQLTANFTDPSSSDTHNATIRWGDGNTSFINIPEGNYTVNCSYKYQETGVYTINLTVEDDDGGNNTMIFRYVVMYDPSGGFVTGGGWIDSPEVAYTPDPSLSGKANFGFVSKYKKGQQEPIGNTEFQFHAADMNFHSDNYDWLVIAGAKAMYKGTGTINGSGNYGFMLFAIDEDLTPSTDVDLFRIKIWDKDNNDEVIYDNQLGDDDDADLTTEIGGGQIKIQGG